MKTEEKLDELAEYKAKKTLLDLEKQKLIDTVYTPEIKQKIQDIEAEFAGKAETVVAKIIALTEECVAEAVAAKSSVQGKFLMVVYNPGGSTCSASDVEKLALTYEKVNKKLAEELRGLIKSKKSSASVQPVKKEA